MMFLKQDPKSLARKLLNKIMIHKPIYSDLLGFAQRLKNDPKFIIFKIALTIF